MLNSEKMVASIGNQDLDHADKYFKKALREDPTEAVSYTHLTLPTICSV